MFAGGTINIEGGTFDGTKKNNDPKFAALFESISLKNCTIKNFDDSLFINSSDMSVTIGKDVTFSNVSDAVYLYRNCFITLEDDLSKNVVIFIQNPGSIKAGEKVQITTTTDNSTLKDKIVPYYSSRLAVGYDKENQYYYMMLFKKNGQITYTSDQANNEIDAIDKDGNKLTLTISASDTSYTGQAYDGLTITNKISEVLDVEPTYSYEGIDGTTYGPSSSAPTNSGKYKVTVSLGGQSISTTFEIAKEDTSAKDLKQAKEDAINELKKYVDNKKNEVSKLNNISDTDKETYKDSLDKKLKELETSINEISLDTSDGLSNEEALKKAKESINALITSGESSIDSIVYEASKKTNNNSSNNKTNTSGGCPNNTTWSETLKSCVYKVSNTNTK